VLLVLIYSSYGIGIQVHIIRIFHILCSHIDGALLLALVYHQTLYIAYTFLAISYLRMVNSPPPDALPPLFENAILCDIHYIGRWQRMWVFDTNLAR